MINHEKCSLSEGFTVFSFGSVVLVKNIHASFLYLYNNAYLLLLILVSIKLHSDIDYNLLPTSHSVTNINY